MIHAGYTRARIRRVPLTQGQRRFCSDDAWRGGEELMQKGGGLFFSPLPQFRGTSDMSISLDFLRLVSCSWNGYKIPPGCINESVEER